MFADPSGRQCDIWMFKHQRAVAPTHFWISSFRTFHHLADQLSHDWLLIGFLIVCFFLLLGHPLSEDPNTIKVRWSPVKMPGICSWQHCPAAYYPQKHQLVLMMTGTRWYAMLPMLEDGSRPHHGMSWSSVPSNALHREVKKSLSETFEKKTKVAAFGCDLDFLIGIRWQKSLKIINWCKIAAVNSAYLSYSWSRHLKNSLKMKSSQSMGLLYSWPRVYRAILGHRVVEVHMNIC